MAIDLFANVINEDALKALTPKQLDQVGKILDKVPSAKKAS